MKESLSQVLGVKSLKDVFRHQISENTDNTLKRGFLSLSNQLPRFTEGVIFLHNFVDKQREVVSTRVREDFLVEERFKTLLLSDLHVFFPGERLTNDPISKCFKVKNRLNSPDNTRPSGSSLV